MATWGDVGAVAMDLPEVVEGVSRGQRQWKVRGRLFVWERPLREADKRALAPRAPDGAILGARVEHEGAKEALIADDPETFFTTPHFDGHAIVLARLEPMGPELLREVVVEAWLCAAPVRLVRDRFDGSS